MIVEHPGERKLVRMRSEGRQVSDGTAYVKVIPVVDGLYTAWSQTRGRLASHTRGIPGFLKSEDSGDMVKIFAITQDMEAKRSSLHLLDFKLAGTRSRKDTIVCDV